MSYSDDANEDKTKHYLWIFALLIIVLVFICIGIFACASSLEVEHVR